MIIAIKLSEERRAHLAADRLLELIGAELGAANAASLKYIDISNFIRMHTNSR